MLLNSSFNTTGIIKKLSTGKISASGYFGSGISNVPATENNRGMYILVDGNDKEIVSVRFNFSDLPVNKDDIYLEIWEVS